ncbi:hypothetical protein GCM10010182_73620 [Actinomadura cremea]|nr:hypothetical protein GCM10010182_73620 [Actinomadura cremea]
MTHRATTPGRFDAAARLGPTRTGGPNCSSRGASRAPTTRTARFIRWPVDCSAPAPPPRCSQRLSSGRAGTTNVFVVDVSWDCMHDEPEPFSLSLYLTFDLGPEDA